MRTSTPIRPSTRSLMIFARHIRKGVPLEEDRYALERKLGFAGQLDWTSARNISKAYMSGIVCDMARHAATLAELKTVIQLFDTLPRNRWDANVVEGAGEVLGERAAGHGLALPEGWQDTVNSTMRGPTATFWGTSMLRADRIAQGKTIQDLIVPEVD